MIVKSIDNYLAVLSDPTFITLSESTTKFKRSKTEARIWLQFFVHMIDNSEWKCAGLEKVVKIDLYCFLKVVNLSV